MLAKKLGEESIEVILEYFDDNKNEIDLSNVVRDTLLLEKPLKTICNKNCKGLCSNCGSNLNFEDCKCLEN